MRAQVAQRGPARQRRTQLLRGGRREQRLAAVTRGGDALSAHDGQRRNIVAVARFRVAGVQPHAHAHRADLAPVSLVQRALRVEAPRLAASPGFSNTEQKRRPTTWNTWPRCASIALLQQRVMARQRLLHRIGMLLDQPRRALDVGEQRE